jgi:ABC-type uncharacterized transport system substrate-binding protein
MLVSPTSFRRSFACPPARAASTRIAIRRAAPASERFEILMELTRSIPIVTPSGTSVIERGYVESLARPGGNVTGFATIELSVVGKMLQTLKEIAPNVAQVSIHNRALGRRQDAADAERDRA